LGGNREISMANKGKLLQQAQKHLTKGNLDKAIKVFQQLVEADPRDTRLVLRLAELMSRAGRKKGAIEHYEKVATVHIRDEFFPKAIAVFKTILRLDPEYLPAYERLADLYKKQGLEGEAISQLQGLYEIHERKKNENKMIDVLRLMAEIDPENLGFQVRLGESLAKKGDKKEAAEAFAMAATTLSRRGFHDRASELFNKIIGLNPENVAVRRELCSHYLESGHFEEAKKEIEAILEAEPDDPRMMLLLGRILFKLGDVQTAEEKLARAIEIFQGLGELDGVMKEFLFVAQVHQNNGELDEAEAFYRQIHAARPSESKAINGLIAVSEARGDESRKKELLAVLGQALSADGDYGGARQALEASLEMDPSDESVRTLLDQIPEEVEEPPDLAEALDVAEITEIIEPAEIEEEADDLAEAVTVVEDEAFAEVGDLAEVISIADEDVEEQEMELVDDGGEPVLEEDDDSLELEAGEEVFQVDEIEMDEEMPEFVLDDSGAETGVASHDLPGPEDDSPQEIPFETSLEDGLLEIDVYRKYGLMEKVMEILADLETRYPGEPQVYEKGFEIYIEAGSDQAFKAGRDLIQDLVGRGDVNRAREIYGRASQSFPDSPELGSLSELLPVDDHQAVQTEVPPQEGIEEAGVVAGVEGAEEKPGVPDWTAGEAYGDPFADQMEEADFYRSQGLEGDARDIYAEILRKDPGHQAAQDAITELQSPSEVTAVEGTVAPQAPEAGDAEPVPSEAPPGDEAVAETKGKVIVEDSTPEVDSFLDLAEEIRSELDTDLDEKPQPAHPDDGPVTFEEIFTQFKQGIEETLGEQEYETHYNLGIAYKDMGLTDDAIRELEISSRDPNLLQESLSIMAMCFMDKKDYDSAVKTLQKGMENAQQDHLPGLNYQLGQAHEANGNLKNALEAFSTAQGMDSSIEGLEEAIERIQGLMEGTQEASAPSPVEEDSLDHMLSDLIKEVEDISRETREGSSDEDKDPPPKTKKDRVSYL
jgi:tetratricopeptide (TPR) repeat protein